MTVRGWRALVVILLTAVLGLGAALLVAVRALQVAEQRSCDLTTAFDDAYREAPPQTPAGRQIADQVAALRHTYDCRPGR
ncbi:hypothetical protein [Micromonospora sp. RTGN7]|uniref:hypothetical protein n=1 Tax=Micromonospora sp. RTGN7 TaxID=3016526 RepID=UPI0029FF543F|nr:hypothetical protein [Micromonospora sp. RTGN7]